MEWKGEEKAHQPDPGNTNLSGKLRFKIASLEKEIKHCQYEPCIASLLPYAPRTSYSLLMQMTGVKTGLKYVKQ